MDYEQELLKAVKDQGEALEKFKAKYDSKFDEFERRSNIPFAFGDCGTEGVKLKTSKGEATLLRHDQRISSKAASNSYIYGDEDEGSFTIGGFVREAILGSTKAVGTGPALVPTAVNNHIIDAVRAQTVINQAGATTLIIDEPTNFARIDGDPIVYQHTENTDDISESDVTIGAVSANPKMLAAVVPLSEEVVQDSPNLDAVLTTSIAAAFALKLDGLTLAKLLADAAIPDSALAQDPADWAKILAAVGSAMALNQQLPIALIGNPVDFIARAGQVANSAGSWLGKPPALAAMLDLTTTGIPEGKAILGDFGRGLIIGMRAGLRIEVVRWRNATKAQHALVAHMRADGYVAQPNVLYRMLKTVI